MRRPTRACVLSFSVVGKTAGGAKREAEANRLGVSRHTEKHREKPVSTEQSFPPCLLHFQMCDGGVRDRPLVSLSSP